jgi:exopolyphosphatase/guanosine-5'-triphosphate,3'-diphosphate pyrophosphatase
VTLAAIDIGTNSVKLLVGRVSGNHVTPLLQRVVITRLGEGLQKSGVIAPAAAERTIAALAELRALAERRGAKKISVTGTFVLRAAKNRRAFLQRCRRDVGLAVRVLSGTEEARISFQGASGAVRASRILAIDIGGGSTEIMLGAHTSLHASWSLPIGAVTLTERFLATDPPAARELTAMSAAIRRALRRVTARVGRHGELVGIGGTVSSILALLRRKNVKSTTISALSTRLSLKTTEERERMGIEPGRSDILVAGAWILNAAMLHLEAPSLRASVCGLRHGLLIDLARLSPRLRNPIIPPSCE